MSTKAIEEALRWMEDRGEAVGDALAELEAIRKAMRAITENGGREPLLDAGYEESVELLQSIAKEDGQ